MFSGATWPAYSSHTNPDLGGPDDAECEHCHHRSGTPFVDAFGQVTDQLGGQTPNCSELADVQRWPRPASARSAVGLGGCRISTTSSAIPAAPAPATITCTSVPLTAPNPMTASTLRAFTRRSPAASSI